MVDPWTYFLVEEIIFPEESGGVTGEGAFGTANQPAGPPPEIVDHEEAARPAQDLPTPESDAGSPAAAAQLSAAEARRRLKGSEFSIDIDDAGLR